jgi:DNA invertase Pin-like site-specific DNA recombinase
MEKETKEIRIYPEKASLLAKILELHMQGYTDYKIAKELRESDKTLKVTDGTVKRDRERIERDYARIVKFFDTIQQVGYFAKKQRERFLSPQTREHAHETIHELLAQGVPLPVGNATRVAKGYLGCYKQVKNRIEVNPERVPLAQQLFETYYNGGNISKFCKDNGLSRRNIKRTLVNPIFIGKIIYRGKEYFFPQLVIIDPKIWEACQPHKKAAKWIGSRPMFGLIRKAGNWIKDPKAELTVLEVIELGLAGKSRNEIARLKDLKYDTVKSILDNPIYANKVFDGEKYVDAGLGFEIVPFNKWLKAHTKYVEKLKKDRYSFSTDAKKNKQNERRDELFDWLKGHDDVHWSEIQSGFKFKDEKSISRTCLDKYLRFLKLDNKIEKRDGGWYVKPENY